MDKFQKEVLEKLKAKVSEKELTYLAYSRRVK